MSHSDLYNEIDRYAYTNTLSKSSPLAKIAFALSALIISVSAPTIVIPAILIALNAILLLVIARIPLRFYLHLLELPMIALVLSCIIIGLFFGYGDPLTQVTTPWFTWSIYQSGISMALSTFFRVLGAISCTFFLVLTTSMTDLFVTLRKIKIPKILIELSLLVYRYIFVFMEISDRINVAQNLRLGHSSIKRRIRSLSFLAGNLFIRTLEQGERTFTAMNARGYDGDIRLLEELAKPRKVTVAAIVIFNLVFFITIFLLYFKLV